MVGKPSPNPDKQRVVVCGEHSSLYPPDSETCPTQLLAPPTQIHASIPISSSYKRLESSASSSYLPWREDPRLAQPNPTIFIYANLRAQISPIARLDLVDLARDPYMQRALEQCLHGWENNYYWYEERRARVYK